MMTIYKLTVLNLQSQCEDFFKIYLLNLHDLKIIIIIRAQNLL